MSETNTTNTTNTNNTNNIISSQSWQSLMHALHNDVRNSRCLKLTGMAALNEINNYLLLFFIERNFEKYPTLDDSCKFSYMYETYCMDEHIKSDTKNYSSDPKKNTELNYYKVWNHWCNTQNPNCVLRKLAGSARIQKYLQNEALTMCAFTQSSDTGKTIQTIINRIWKQFALIADSDDPLIVMNLPLESFGFDAFGDAYEKFKLDMSSNSGKTTGQHFTPDIVKRFIIDETKPLYSEKFYEPACGTGGFIHHGAKYIRDHSNNNLTVKYVDIDSSEIMISPYDYFVRNLTANECNPEIYKPLAINMLIHDIPIDRIKKQDSLDNLNIGQTIDAYDIICANPPFGAGDEVNIYDQNYWGPLRTGKNVIKDAMAQFIMHMYQSLKKGGRCGTVSDRGILNNGTDGKNSWQTKLRKFMLENTNLYKIVLLPKDTFEYTTFATCVIFFTKGQPTKQVEFRELTFKDVVVDGSKTKEIAENKLLGKISIDQIKAKNYSLKADDYFKVVEAKHDMNEWVRLGDICKLERGKSLPSNKIIEGEYPVIGGGVKYSGYHNEYNYDGSNGIFISRVGTAGYVSRYCDKCYITDLIFVLEPNKNIDIKYLYYYLFVSKNDIEKLRAQNGAPNISWTNLQNFLIPNLPLSHQTEIVEFLDKQFQLYQINKLNKQIPLFDLLIKKEWQMATELLHLVYRQMATLDELANIKTDIKAIFSLSVYGLRQQSRMMKLGDVVDFKNYKPVKIEQASNIGKYPFYNCSIVGHLWSDEYLYDDEVLIMNKTNGTGKCHIFYNNGPFTISGGVIIFKPKQNLNIMYLHNYLNSHKSKISEMFEGGDKKNINISNFKNLQIPIPQHPTTNNQ
jgi:type I restriction-modification system DNA methylase subunit/restriction endonuclease S subunit